MMAVGSAARSSSPASAVGADRTPIKQPAKAKIDTNDVFILTKGSTLSLAKVNEKIKNLWALNYYRRRSGLDLMKMLW